MKLNLIRIIMIFIFTISAYKWSDWKNWKLYYPTMLFFGMGDLIYVAVFHDKPLWSFPSKFLIPPLDELVLIFTVFFSATLLFLSNYPQKLNKKIPYIILWIGIFMVIEVFDLKVGMIEHHNKWNLWWSLLHNSIQFPLLALHHKRPILAWIIALIFLIIIMHTFNMNFTVYS